MAEPVIRVQQLGKKYRIGMAEKKSDTITGAILNGLKSPLTNLKQIRNLSKLDVEDDSIFWALRDVSFEVQEGEVLGIIGHNGAGKSTLLKILAQITEPSIGEVRIHGRVAALLEVGTGFHPELTGRENIYMNGTILGMRKKEIDKKLEEILDFSGVEKYLDTPVKFYSSGMRVRIGFAVAAHLEPDILIIDEVLAVGDAEFQKKCLGKMEDAAKQGRTVLFVSHNLNAVVNLCSRSILLDKGLVTMDGGTKEVVDYYLSNKTFREVESAKSDNFLKSIFFMDDKNVNKNEFYFDEEIIFCFSFENIESRSKIGLAVYDEYERKVFIDFFNIPSSYYNSVIKARLPRKSLTPGIYNLTLSLLNPYEKVYWLKSNVSVFQISKLASKYEKLTYDFGVINLDILWEC